MVQAAALIEEAEVQPSEEPPRGDKHPPRHPPRIDHDQLQRHQERAPLLHHLHARKGANRIRSVTHAASPRPTPLPRSDLKQLEGPEAMQGGRRALQRRRGRAFYPLQ
jgi:hypothetical protein